MTSEIRTVAAVMYGRVQGVDYRVWTRTEAGRFGVNGHVRNRADGAVEAIFSGPPDAVATLLEACRRGPPGARVTDVTVTDHPGEPPAGGFTIR